MSSLHKPLKKIHSRSKKGTVMYQRLRNGTLDVDLETGEVFGLRGRKFVVDVTWDGYHRVHLTIKNNRCKPDGRGQRRFRQRAMVHRIVMMKKLAVEAKGGSRLSWRSFVKELPTGVDVDHEDDDRENNRASNLQLKTYIANRSKRDMTPEEEESIREYYAEIDF